MSTLTSTNTSTKKGNRSWSPPTGDVIQKEKGFGYRWTNPDEIPARLQEGWELVQAKDGQTTFMNGKDRVFGGVPLDTVVAKKNTVLMRMADELVEQRNAYYGKKAHMQANSIKAKAQELSDGGVTHGDVTMNGRPVQTIIE
jgi:hypothetical protein